MLNSKFMAISFSGQHSMGKDVSADYLKFNLQSLYSNRLWNRIAFADEVKNTYCSAFGVDREFIEKWKRNPEPPPGMQISVRRGLQLIGDGFRKIDENIWIKKALGDFSRNLIISDGRYINEGKHLKQNKAINVLVYRDGFLNDDQNRSEAEIRPLLEYCLNNQIDGEIIHQENEPKDLFYYDYFLRNSGSLEDLYKKIDNTLIPFLDKVIKSYGDKK